MKIERDILFTSECSQPSDRPLLSLPGGKIEMLGCSLKEAIVLKIINSKLGFITS